MTDGIIIKALSGFYYVRTPEGVLECKARGKLRMDGTSPLVGDRVRCIPDGVGRGRLESVQARRNSFIRPAVANVDALVFIASNVNPVTDPFLIDRVSVIAAASDCELIVCVNKTDLDPGTELTETFRMAGFPVVCTSAATGEGVAELRRMIDGKVCALTGNSGVGKSSLLNVLVPDARIATGEVSDRLGRGRHTTRHVELYDLGGDTYVADTPGFASFDLAMMEPIAKEQLQYFFPDFAPYLGGCRFADCAHLKEPDCTITRAVAEGHIAKSRSASYQRLYELSAAHKFWELKTE